MSSAPLFRKLMCANRGEIAIRVFRAATELGIPTLAIFSHEDRVHLHRYKADQAFLVGKGNNPVAAYLDIEEILRVAKDNGVEAIHPGYGFLSERADFAARCAEEGIVFVGPRAEVLTALGDKVSARHLAMECGVATVPGTRDPIARHEDALDFVAQHGFPILIKAAMGGGGRGMRVVRDESELEEAFRSATAEAQAAFGDGTVFVERYLENPRHIEVQLLGDSEGELMHLYERDCSVQRRHQKLLEMAPAVNLDAEVREAILEDALKLGRHVDYTNAGTAEFLVDKQGRHYFIEVNPRIQVEHTVTEECTGVDIVQAQIRIASGQSLADLGLTQSRVKPRGYAIQCRVTTEKPAENFMPDTGKIEVYRTGQGMGIRLDGGSGYSGAQISPHYDPLLVKVTGSGRSFAGTVRKLARALSEFRIRGVETNIPFLLQVLQHPRFHAGEVDTGFVDSTPELFDFPKRQNRAQRLLRYLGEMIVNGPMVPGSNSVIPERVEPEIPQHEESLPPTGLRDVLQKEGPEAFARAVREHPGVLVTDTTWRDAHQSLLATRVRTIDLVAIAPSSAEILAPCYSLEMWGGATFDVALRFLRECPWSRLERLREVVPNIPFQMLLRGANAVGYTSYPDNVVRRFVQAAKRGGIDVFRIFDSLNYIENLKLGIDCVGEAGGVIEASICYTGDVSDPGRTKYSLSYYLDLVGELVDLGIHVLAIKDMAGLLKPRAARILVGKLRESFPDLPIHVHTHDTAGAGLASMLACSDAGADAIDLALSSMAGLTSQPSLGAFVAAVAGSDRDTGMDLDRLGELNSYWEQVRLLYAPFESGLKSGSVEVYQHEMPGGQYTNLEFQARALGLSGRWTAIKHAYREANFLLGDVIKVTPTSKVVGDLAQFMVQNDLNAKTVLQQAETLSFPSSVHDFMQGRLGQPYRGFPEPLRTKVLHGDPPIDGRPGKSLDPLDFDQLAKDLETRHGETLREEDLLSAALYPQVFDDYMDFKKTYSKVCVIPTRPFLTPLEPGEEISIEIEHGKTLIVAFKNAGTLDADGNRPVYFELNGQPRTLLIPDREAQQDVVKREVANPADPGSLGAPMLGVVATVHVEVGQEVDKQEPLLTMTAMKMETIVTAPIAGVVDRIPVSPGDTLAAGDLLLTLTPNRVPGV